MDLIFISGILPPNFAMVTQEMTAYRFQMLPKLTSPFQRPERYFSSTKFPTNSASMPDE
jgi:hypothetical protein